MITLRQLAEMFLSLPKEVLDKEVSFLDLGHMMPDDLEHLRLNLLESEDDTIQECSN